jgi:hypothetical protein
MAVAGLVLGIQETLGIFWTVKHWILVGGLGCLAMSAVAIVRKAASADRTAADHP